MRASLKPGTTLGHFEILDLLGAGGMGKVYKARDSSLDRLVALKVLSADLFEDDDARARFLREAHLASLLIHSNVATVHEMNEVHGVLFIAMELVPGGNLKQKLDSGPLSLPEVLSLGAQICDALSAAHKLGIVHRDIKSSNVMVTPEGLVKVLDFGLAKALSDPAAIEADATPGRSDSSPESSDSSNSEGVTLRGTALGTPHYMSPEQASGGMVDERSDIFSLGVVLYEAATGELPFRGETDRKILAAVRAAKPPLDSLTLPSGFLKLLAKCLAKKPEERYPTAQQVRIELERLKRTGGEVSPGRARARILIAFSVAIAAAVAVLGYRFWNAPDAVTYPAIRTIGVLPFENVSGNPEENYLAAAVPLELTSRLGQIPAIKVVPWTFMVRYRDQSMSLGQIRRESGADAVLEGAVALVPRAPSDPRTLVRIQTQLFDTATGVLLWSDSVERDLGSFLRVRGEIAERIANLVQVQLAHRERLQIASNRDVDPEAMVLYLKGSEALEDRNVASLNRAVEYLEAATSRAPDFAEAHVGLAEAYILLSAYLGVLSAERAHRLSLRATERALEIDRTLGDAWATQAYAHYVLAWDWAKAAEEFTRSLELSPHSADVRYRYSDYLSAKGHHKEALEQSRMAESRSPLSVHYSRRVAWTLFFARRYDEAIDQLEKTLEMDPGFVPARTLLGRALVQKGRYDEAIAELEAVGDSYSAMLAHAYAAAGRRNEAENVLASLLSGKTSDPLFPYEVAQIYAALGDADTAFEWLEKAFQLRDPTMVSLKTDPFLDPLRGDPRFEDFLERMKFPR